MYLAIVAFGIKIFQVFRITNKFFINAVCEWSFCIQYICHYVKETTFSLTTLCHLKNINVGRIFSKSPTLRTINVVYSRAFRIETLTDVLSLKKENFDFEPGKTYDTHTTQRTSPPTINLYKTRENHKRNEIRKIVFPFFCTFCCRINTQWLSVAHGVQ